MSGNSIYSVILISITDLVYRYRMLKFEVQSSLESENTSGLLFQLCKFDAAETTPLDFNATYSYELRFNSFNIKQTCRWISMIAARRVFELITDRCFCLVACFRYIMIFL